MYNFKIELTQQFHLDRFLHLVGIFEKFNFFEFHFVTEFCDLRKAGCVKVTDRYKVFGYYPKPTLREFEVVLKGEMVKS